MLIQMTLTTLTVTVSLVGVVWLSQTLRLIELLVNRGASMMEFVKITSLSVPLWLLILLPVAGLIGGMMVLSRLHHDREITVMQASGISNLGIARPVVLLGIGITTLLYVNSFQVLPMSFSNYKTLLASIRNAAPIVVLQEGVFTDLAKGLTMFIGKRQQDGELEDIFVHDARNPENAINISASSGFFDLSTSPPVLTMYDGTRTEMRKNAGRATVLEFSSYTLTLTRDIISPPPRYQDYNEMSISTLLRGEHQSSKYAREMVAEGHYRMTAPLLGLSLLMMGAALVLHGRHPRGGGRWRYMMAALATIIIESSLISARSLAATNPMAIYIMYVVVLAPAAFGYAVLSLGTLKNRMVPA